MAKEQQETGITDGNAGLFDHPEIKESLGGGPGLTPKNLEQAVAALTRMGVGLILQQGRHKSQVRQRHLPRSITDSVSFRAAHELGISATHLTRKLNAIESDGSLHRQTAAGDQRILEMSQALSTLSGNRSLERIDHEGDQMKVSELAKSTSSTNQVAAKQRWSQGRLSQPKRVRHVHVGKTA
jgi:DNA-binding HxlR family transcriptional regulator